MHESSATLAELVAESIRQQLRDGVYPCGARIAELTIAKEMNISQNTARDALHLLIEEGWLVKRPRYGITVRHYTSAQAEEVYLLWGTLEKLVIQWVLQTITVAEIAHIRRLISLGRDQSIWGYARDIQTTRMNIHHFLLILADKPQTTFLLQRLYNQVWLLEGVRDAYAPRTAVHYRELFNGYDTMCRALSERDLRTAQEAMYQLILEDAKPLFPILDLVG